MNFEEFEKKILEKGYGIVAMNHHIINGKICQVKKLPVQTISRKD